MEAPTPHTVDLVAPSCACEVIEGFYKGITTSEVESPHAQTVAAVRSAVRSLGTKSQTGSNFRPQVVIKMAPNLHQHNPKLNTSDSKSGRGKFRNQFGAMLGQFKLV